MGCCITTLIFYACLFFGAKKLWGYYKKWKLEKMLDKWSHTPADKKDKVILHTVIRARTVPCMSPFSLKLETYLRLAKIPYELDHSDPRGPKGKLPWITYNGEHVGDSQLIIKYLNKQRKVDLNQGKSPEQVAAASACRIMLEDHFFWGAAQYRIIENIDLMPRLMKVRPYLRLIIPFMRLGFIKRMDDIGVGKHSPTEIYQMTLEDLRTVAKVLGNKKFLGGDEPCEDDCAVFGILAQTCWSLPGSPFETLVETELKTLKEYCERVKVKVFPDWEHLLDHP